MKKIIIILVVVVVVIIAPLILMISQYREEQSEIKTFNAEFEIYKDNVTYGTNVASLINFAIDNNEKYEIEKDENGSYLDDDKYCLRIEVKLQSSEDENILITYGMETIASLGVSRFVSNFNLLEFKCTEIQYNSTGRINKVIFEINE